MEGLEALDRQLYTIPEAARILRMPASTLRWWLEGRYEHPPVLREESTGSNAVTWGEFVEAGCLREYRRRHVQLHRLRQFIDTLRDRLKVPYPLAYYEPLIGEGRRLLLEAQELAYLSDAPLVWEAVSGQIVLDGHLEVFVERIDFSESGWAERIHPIGRDSPVVIDPDYAFGAPTVGGTRTEVLAELIDAGEDPTEVAEDFGLSIAVVRAATAYEWLAAAA